MPKKVVPEGASSIRTFGPYTSVIQVGNHFYFAGIIPDLTEGDPPWKPLHDDPLVQYEEVVANMVAALAAVGLSMADVIRTRVFFRGATNGAQNFNRFYVAALGGIAPVSTMIGAFDLPFGVQIEIEIDAVQQDE